MPFVGEPYQKKNSWWLSSSSIHHNKNTSLIVSCYVFVLYLSPSFEFVKQRCTFGLARSGSFDSFPQVVFSFQICYLKKLKCIWYIRDIELEPDTSKVVKNFKHWTVLLRKLILFLVKRKNLPLRQNNFFQYLTDHTF